MVGTTMSGASMLEPAAVISTTSKGSPYTQAWTIAMQLEKRLKAESRKRSFWDPEVRRDREV